MQLVADLPYVDKTRIGVTGHSNGALASRMAVMQDNLSEDPLIASALLVSNDAVYFDENGDYTNIFGTRDAAVVACQYDEFFHRVEQEDGTMSAPRDYIEQNTAQSFLQFGVDPEGLEQRESYEIYKQTMDGEEVLRAIYNPEIIHPWAHFSMNVVESSVEFFEQSLGAPEPIEASNQIWIYKAMFNGLGLIGFLLFMVHFTLMLLGTKCFAALKTETEVVAREPLTGKAKTWFWLSMLLGVVFSFAVYMFGSGPLGKTMPKIFPQSPVYFIGVWSLLCGLFTLLLLMIGTKVTGRNKQEDNGVKISGKKLLLTIALSLTVVIVSYGLVFVADYVFKTDFRLWVLALKAFNVDKLPIALLYLPFFLVYYIANSVAINGYNHFKIGKKGKSNIGLLALFNGLAPIIMIVLMYSIFAITGHLPNETVSWFGGSIIGIWLFPMVIILPVSGWVSRKLYKATNNPYLGGIIMALVITIMMCTNTLTTC